MTYRTLKRAIDIVLSLAEIICFLSIGYAFYVAAPYAIEFFKTAIK